MSSLGGAILEGVPSLAGGAVKGGGGVHEVGAMKGGSVKGIPLRNAFLFNNDSTTDLTITDIFCPMCFSYIFFLEHIFKCDKFS